MKNKLILVFVILLVISAVLFTHPFSRDSHNLVNPAPQPLSTPSATITPTPTPPELHFDSSTNLQKELDLVKPEIRQSDFDSVEKTSSSL